MSDRERLEELGNFLKTRRERVTPAQVGLPATPRRRVRGLRREEVASLAGIGVSWYTLLETGDARGVSEMTLRAVAEALRLSPSERDYLITLAGTATGPEDFAAPSPLIVETLHAISFPAYIINVAWDVLDFNDAFRRVWAISKDETLPFNAVERLFVHPRAREMHGDRFERNIRPVIAMLRSSQGRRAHLEELRQLRDRLLRDELLKAIWGEYEVSGPLLSNVVRIDSAIGDFTYETVTLPFANSSGIVVQVPDRESRANLKRSAAE